MRGKKVHRAPAMVKIALAPTLVKVRAKANKLMTKGLPRLVKAIKLGSQNQRLVKAIKIPKRVTV